MDRWEIRPTPSADDPDRHLLLIQGGPKDVAVLLKKFGALFGRPMPYKGEGYNLSLVLHRFKAGTREKLETWLGKPPSAPEPAPEPAPLAAPAELTAAIPLREAWTLESILVGPYNRFVHAAAMSAVSSPGAMYNPLFLHGLPGTGKSHFLHAIGSELAKGPAGTGLLMTSGSRLSRVADAALERKNTAELDALAQNSTALLVDDIHLLAVSDQNKDYLAKFFKAFFDRKAQVVITSLYPPRSLGAIEEALKFSFSKGWAVDLKVPSPAAQKDVISASVERVGGGLSEEDVSLLHEKLSQWGYQDLALWLKRVVVFRRIREAAGQPAAMADILPLIYDPLLSAGGEAPQTSAVSFQPPAAGPSAPAMAVIAPKGQEGLGPRAASLFYEIGSKNGFSAVYRHVLWDVYDEAQSFGVPFAIGEMCRRAAVSRAIIVGPPPDSPLGPRAAEFAHAVRRILESFGIEMGWLPFIGLQTPAYYLNAHLDLAPAPAKAAA